MNHKFLSTLVLFSVFLVPLDSQAVSADNDYVTVECNDSKVVSIFMPNNMDFHLITSNAEMDFVATVTVTPKGAYVLQNPQSGSLSIGIGATGEYTVGAFGEPGETGHITVYKVDVEIKEINETEEEVKGAFLADESQTAYSKAMVLIKCYPDHETEPLIQVSNVSPISSASLREAVGKTEAKAVYSPAELKNLVFELGGGIGSENLRENRIFAEHIENGCSDFAKYTILTLNVTALSHYKTDDKHRTTYGIDESVQMEVSPQYLTGEWYEDGTPIFVASSIQYTCPGTNACPVIGVYFPLEEVGLSRQLTVIEPKAVVCHQAASNINGEIPFQEDLSNAGTWMFVQFQILPTTVSFENVSFSENFCLTSTATGYFSDESLWFPSRREYFPAMSSFGILAEHNIFDYDPVSTGACPTNMDEVYCSGSIRWDLSASYLGHNSGILKSPIQWTSLAYHISENGTVTATKYGASSTRSPNQSAPAITQ